MALLVWLAWFGVMIAALAVAGLLLTHGGAAKAGWALLAILGGLMAWGLVSAVVGLYEHDNYAATREFAVAMAIGAGGLVSLAVAWLCGHRPSRYI